MQQSYVHTHNPFESLGGARLLMLHGCSVGVDSKRVCHICDITFLEETVLVSISLWVGTVHLPRASSVSLA